ncbi:MAG: response regulator [Marinilabiliaceae bacterium]|jgi:CheY-like chemotaxis protein|nr:response regulator [Marinilabiliaceae bacterium]
MAGIMVVEDDSDLREMISESLKKRGEYMVIEASNGREAIKKFKSLLIDMVITDIVMPELDGIGLIMELRKMKDRIKVIAISGGGKVGPVNYLSIAKTMGAEAVFTKPFSIKALVDKVEELL